MRSWIAGLVFALAAGVAPGEPVKIAEGVHLLRGTYEPGSQPDGNSVIFEASDGLVVVDTGRHESHNRALLDFAAKKKQPIVAAINTHWHLDHIGGNALLRREEPGIRIWASPALEDALRGFLADYRTSLESRLAALDRESEEKKSLEKELALITAGKELAPDEVVRKSGRPSIGGRRMALNLETHAVTAGDLWIVDEETRVVVAGDLITLPFPFLDTACPSRWKEALDRLARTQFALVVPGHGAPMKRAELDRYRTAYANLLDCAASSKPKEACAAGWIGDAGPLIAESERDLAGQAIHYYVDQHLRGHEGKLVKLCGR